MNSILKKLSFFHYNIGFFSFSDQIFSGNVKINWMIHSYKDRFFADPFILEVTPNEIKVLVEEFLYKKWKGRISLLTIDKHTYQLKDIKVLLDLETHLSFPFIFRTEQRIYVIPENSASGSLHAYRYKEEDESLHYEGVIAKQPIVDPVIIQQNDFYILFGSLPGKNENKDLFMWKSDGLLKEYTLVNNIPVISNRASCARRGGNFFFIKEELFSAVQSCVNSYGEALNLCKVRNISDSTLEEEIVSTLYPDNKYSEGLHTFNQYKGICVVDGLTYLFSPIQKIIVTIK